MTEYDKRAQKNASIVNSKQISGRIQIGQCSAMKNGRCFPTPAMTERDESFSRAWPQRMYIDRRNRSPAQGVKKTNKHYSYRERLSLSVIHLMN